MQMHFEELDETKYEIDERLTRKESMKLLNRYRTFKLGTNEYDIKVTSTYTTEPRTFNNQFSSNVEDTVVRKLEYMQTIEDAVNRMNDPDERRIIIEGYLSREKHNWVKMSAKLHLNKTDYYILRHKALISFASSLNKEVFKYPRKIG